MRSAVALLLVLVIAACGSDTTGSQPIESTAPSMEPVTTALPSVSTESATTSASPQAEPDPTTTATLAPAGEAAVIESELGRVSYTLPLASTADPRPEEPLPEFVVGAARWIVPDCCLLIVVLQNLEPPMAAWEMTDNFEANGIQWELYDTGPQDGTLIIARGTAKPITVLVTAQGPLGNSAAGLSPQTVVAQVARTVVVDPITSA
ncbi:MAG: hypothetical protein U0Q03_11200 [Acidimicrobiales bacterium]